MIGDIDLDLLLSEAQRLYSTNLVRTVRIEVETRLRPIAVLAWDDLSTHVRQHWLALAFLALDGARPDMTCPVDAPFERATTTS